MKRKDCITNTELVVMAPIIREKPEKAWAESLKNKTIPKSVYDFYVLTEYFSFGKCPLFLKDDKKILLSHLEAAVNLIRESFDWHDDLVGLIKLNDSLSYNPLTKAKYDPNASKYANMYFQTLIIKLFSILDAISCVAAIIIPFGDIGRASFNALVEKAKRHAVTNNTGIVIPKDIYLNSILSIIKEEVIKTDNSRDWFELFKMYRNKMSHFHFSRRFWLHDKNGVFYNFLPNNWPYYPTQDIKLKSENDGEKLKTNIIEELTIEQDSIEYLEGVKNQIYILSDRIFEVLNTAYKLKQETNSSIDNSLTLQLPSLLDKYEFKSF